MLYALDVDIEAIKARVAERERARVPASVRAASDLIADNPADARTALTALTLSADNAGVAFTAAEANLLVALAIGDKPGED